MLPDIEINGSNGFYQINGISAVGCGWIMDNVEGSEDAEDFVRAYCDDTRMTQAIADGAAGDGLVVFVNGTVYEAA